MALTVIGAGHVGDECEEVVGLAVQPQRVQAPQRECRIAHPRVAVVPISFALRGFRQRRGGRRQQRAGRRIRQALQRQRAALQIRPPRVIGEVADVDPLPPALAGLPHLVGGLVVGLRDRMLGPGQRDEDVVALLHSGACPRLVALQSQPQVSGQAQRRMRVGVAAGPGDRLAVGLGRVLPRGGDAVVVESRLAVHHQLDRAAHTSHRAQQDVLGVPVHRRTAMRARPRVDVVPRPHHQRVAHDHPAGVGLPGGLQDQAARQVATRRGHRNAIRAQPEVARAAVQDRAEHTGGVGAGDAQPFHRTGRRDQAGVLAVGQERVVGDRRKGVPQRPAAGVRHRCRHGERGFRLADLDGRALAASASGAPSEGSVCCRTMRTSSTAERPGVYSCRRVSGGGSAQRRANSGTCSGSGPIAMAYPAAVRSAGTLSAIRTTRAGLAG